MKLYKYRSISQLAFVFDIIYNRRLYCSPWKDLNDPMEGRRNAVMLEGLARLQSVKDSERRKAKFKEIKNSYKIVSLSATPSEPLMWAHYASGSKGVAIEIDIPDKLDSLIGVDYDNVDKIVHVNDWSESAMRDFVINSFKPKYKCWIYEQERRIISIDDWYCVGAVSSVIFGERTDEATKKALSSICKTEGITTKIARSFGASMDINPYMS